MRTILKMLLPVLVMLAVILISITGHIDYGEYRTFTSWKGGPYFSIEYPRDYGIPWWTEVPETSYVGIDGRVIEGRDYRDILAIDIYINKPGGYRANDAKTELERILSSAKTNYQDFQILGRGIIYISGLKAENVTYSYRHVNEPDSVIIMGFTIFEYDGKIWEISSCYDLENTEEAESGLNHIISTFKILE